MAAQACLLALAISLTLFSSINGQVLQGSFDHGVASGDPMSDRIILWTRVTPRPLNTTSFAVDVNTTTYNVTYTVYGDKGLTTVVKTGSLVTDLSRDFTVKVRQHSGKLLT